MSQTQKYELEHAGLAYAGGVMLIVKLAAANAAAATDSFLRFIAINLSLLGVIAE
ncbi:hypothetical protein [Sinosporangium siamense]|uniref:Uncharacterized protein n=1 Tax=Sinosporangium siamense TaxID=1367973 RepID=A0A919RQ00_9ACTN|nr:hypothetical protein [Sinosporangium siamense]GII97152.1 hypothetical protein Ssi02_73830 [Sinosporangium siamense]